MARWLCLAPGDGSALLDLARQLRLGENQLRDLWTWAEEIAERDHVSLMAALTHPAVGAALRRPISRNDRLKLVKSALRRLRFPHLCSREDDLATHVRLLNLPANIHLTLPENLEGETIRIDIVVGTTAGLRAAASALLAATDTAACARLFELLEAEA